MGLVAGHLLAGPVLEWMWAGEKELNRVWQAEAKFTSKMKPKVREALVKGWHRAVERSKGWVEAGE